MKILATTLLPRDRETQRLRPSQKLFPPSHRRRPRRSVAGCVGPATPAARLLRPRGPRRTGESGRCGPPGRRSRAGSGEMRDGASVAAVLAGGAGGRAAGDVERALGGTSRDGPGRQPSPRTQKGPRDGCRAGLSDAVASQELRGGAEARRWCRPGTRGPRARRIAPWPELEGPRFGQGHVVGQPRQSPVGGAAGEERVEGEGAGSHDPACRTPGLTPRAIRTARPRPRHRPRRGCGRTPPRAAPARPRPPVPRPPPAGSGRRAPARRSRGCAGRGRSPP